MPYLTREEQAMMTQANAAKSGVVSSAAGIGLGIVLGTAANSIYATAVNAKLEFMRGDFRKYAGSSFQIAMNYSLKGISEGVTHLFNEMNDGFNDIIGLTEDGQWAGAGGMFANLRDGWRGPSLLMASYNGIVQSVGIDPYTTRQVNMNVLPNIPNVNWAWYMYHIGLMSAKDYLQNVAWNGWAPKYVDMINFANLSTMSIYDILELKRRGGIADDFFISQMKRCKFDNGQIDLISKLAVVKPEPYRAAEFAARGLIDDATLQESFKWYGLDASWAQVWKKSQQIFPSFDMALSLFWREEISREEVTSWLQRQNVDANTAEHMMILAEPIPPMQDLVTMVVREAWEPTNITPAPDVFARYMHFKGFGKDWSDRYWTAHWLPMPVNLAYANLHRGFWTKEQFDDLLRIADYHPRWREAMYNVAFNAPTVRELGYGYDTGAYSQEDIVRYRRWGGLSPTDATKSAQALVDYRLDAERNALRTGYMNEYINNLIDVSAFRDKLVELRTNPQAIELWVQRADVLIVLKITESSVTEPKNITRSDVQWLYEHDLRDDAWFKLTLKNMGYTDVSAQNYLDISNQKIKDKNAPPAPLTGKELTLAQVISLYYKHELDIRQLNAKLVGLGYTSTAIIDLVKLIIANTPVAEVILPKELTLSQIAGLYQAMVFDDNELLARLKILGYTDNDAKVLASQMLKELNLSQLTRLYYADKIDYNTLLLKVIGLGYTQQDAEQLITIVQLNTPVQKAAPTLTMADIDNLYDWKYYDEEELIQQYKNKGYSDNDAMLKAYLSVLALKVPLLEKQYANGWISEDELFNGLLDISLPFITIGIPESRVNEIMTTVVKNNQGIRTATEKSLTKAEIIKGAKNNIFTIAEAIGMLEDIGYSEDEAFYLLAINKIVTAGDAEGYWQMKQTTQLYKHSQGLSYVVIPDELIHLEAQLKSAKDKLNKDKESKASDDVLGADAVMIAQIESRMNTIISKLNIS